MIVTIITVCRNHAQELERTIRSVESQTWQEKEYLVIDGASTDDTQNVIKAHEASITRWVSEPDQGIYDAMNKGVKPRLSAYRPHSRASARWLRRPRPRARRAPPCGGI